MEKYNAVSLADSKINGLTQIGYGEAMNVLNNLVQTFFDYAKAKEQHITYREEIRANRDVNLAKIEANTRIIREYLEKTHIERKMVLEFFLEKLDTVIAGGNSDMVEMILKSILGVAHYNPLFDLMKQKDEGKIESIIEI